MLSGYSQTPLIKKLGIKPGFRLLLKYAPGPYLEWLGPLPEGVALVGEDGEADFIHLFVKEKALLEAELSLLKQHLTKPGAFWVSWPKKSSKIPTELDGNLVRETGLRAGLVDVKVCAVSETWSGLKFVYRLKDR